MNLMIKKLFQNYRFITALWFGLSLVAVLQTAFRPEKHNNYLIFKGVFWHTIQQLPLYVPYPEEYFDMNHYGIFFSGIIAPFAVLPRLFAMDFGKFSVFVLGYSPTTSPEMGNYRRFIHFRS